MSVILLSLSLALASFLGPGRSLGLALTHTGHHYLPSRFERFAYGKVHLLLEPPPLVVGKLPNNKCFDWALPA